MTKRWSSTKSDLTKTKRQASKERRTRDAYLKTEPEEYCPHYGVGYCFRCGQKLPDEPTG